MTGGIKRSELLEVLTMKTLSIFLTMISLNVYATQSPWKSATSLFDNKTWTIAKYTRKCIEFDHDKQVKEVDCSLMYVGKEQLQSDYSTDKIISKITYGNFKYNPKLIAIRTYASEYYLSIKDQSEHLRETRVYENDSTSWSIQDLPVVIEGEILNEIFGDFKIPKNNNFETTWDESCVNSNKTCNLLQQSLIYPNDYEIRDPSCNPRYACLESIQITGSLKSILARNPLKNSYTLTSEIDVHSNRSETSRIGNLNSTIKVVTELEFK